MKVEEGKVAVTGLIEQNDLSGALSKLKELGGVKTETQVAVTTASNAVNQVVQDAQDVKDAIAPTLVVPPIINISPSSTLNAMVLPLSAVSSTVVAPALTSSTVVEIKKVQ